MTWEFTVLADSLKTKEDLVEKIDSLSSLNALVFKQDNVDKAQLNKVFAGLFYKELPVELATDKEAFSKVIKEAVEFLEKLKVVKLTVAFEPSKDFLLRLKRFFQETLKVLVVIDLTVNPSIIGGLIVENNGKYLDYSASENLDKALVDQEFLKTLLQTEQ